MWKFARKVHVDYLGAALDGPKTKNLILDNFAKKSKMQPLVRMYATYGSHVAFLYIETRIRGFMWTDLYKDFRLVT